MPSHILVVEDQLDTLDMVRDLLELQGYTVTCVEDGDEALSALDQRIPDLIISDVRMPNRDGFELLREVRARPASVAVPFLFLTGVKEAGTSSQIRRLGADDYLVKPFAPEDLSVAVRARLERRRITQRFDTREANIQMALMLANIIEARDRYTRGHLERVQRAAFRMAQALHWDAERMVILEFGTLLHDIGKIMISRQILNKPGKLSETEWEILHRHPEMGTQMVSRISHLRETTSYILYHHERWDGQGYPTGLAGSAIPIEGRLLAIVDAYDSLTSDRAYRFAIPPANALEEIERCAGTQFDPDLTQLFLSLHRSA